ncbi:hypothetical protein GCM10023093_08910 [Nemorincola caseinilytica]|uniref:Uncharacterized protein n=1 Tax=Nemorincola caseinilytica TaxID=2054315 RepID=A0ABP8NAM2_9BACT
MFLMPAYSLHKYGIFPVANGLYAGYVCIRKGNTFTTPLKTNLYAGTELFDNNHVQEDKFLHKGAQLLYVAYPDT